MQLKRRAYQSQEQPHSSLSSRSNQSSGTMGAMGEIAVCLEVMDRGGEALRNLSPNAKNDLCLIVNGTVIQVDVKIAQWKSNSQCWGAGSAGTVKHPVYPVIVTPIGFNYREWQFRWLKDKFGKYKCPPGLENFWD